MAVALIHNGAVCGALAALMAGRSQSSDDPADYGADANVAAAVGAQVLTANAALDVPMADGDNAEITFLVSSAVQGAFEGRTMASTTATDYENEAAVAVAAAKATITKLT